jgi:hypothetical protein
MRSGGRALRNLDLVDSKDVGAYRHTVQFIAVFIRDENGAAYIVAADLYEFPRNLGGMGFRGFQVREMVSFPINVLATLADDFKEVAIHGRDPPPGGPDVSTFMDEPKGMSREMLKS